MVSATRNCWLVVGPLDPEPSVATHRHDPFIVPGHTIDHLVTPGRSIRSELGLPSRFEWRLHVLNLADY